MKCEHCGKNDVQFVYRSNINGKVEEVHLCSECAEKLGYAKKLSAQRSSLMRDFMDPGRFFGDSFFDDFFSPLPSLLGRNSFLGDPFGALLQEENPVRTQEAEKPAGDAPVQEHAEEKAEKTGESRFARMRRLNALRMEMKRAVHREDFERAAEVRDEIRALEAEAAENG